MHSNESRVKTIKTKPAKESKRDNRKMNKPARGRAQLQY